MADENINFEVTGFQNFKTQIREAQVEYQKLLADVNASPAAIAAAATKVGELKDQMGDAAASASALGTTAGKFGAITKGVASLSGGFTALQGAIGLAGGDAKSFEKTMQKVQSAMALTQGLTALADLGDAFNNMKTVAVNAFKAIKGAIGATGIGLLVIALGTIVAYWDEIKAAVSGVSAEQEALNKETAKNAALSQENLDALTASEQQLKLSGKTEEEIYQLKIKQYDATIADARAKQVADQATLDAQVAAAQRNKDILKGVLDFISLPLTFILEAVDKIGLAFGKDFGLREGFKESVAKLLFDPKEIKTEGDKVLKESAIAINKLEESRAGLINQYNDKAKAKRAEERAKRKAEQEKEAAEELARIKKFNEERFKLGEDTAKKFELLGLTQRQKELKAIEDDYAAKLLLAKGDIETTRQLGLLKKADLDALKAKNKAEDDKTEEEKKKKEADDKKIADDKAKEEEDKRKEDRANQIQAAFDTANAVFEAANSIQEAQKQREIEALKAKGLSEEEAAKQTDEINKKYFEKNKGVQIGQAIIQTLQSSIAAFSALAGIPVVGPGLGAIAAAAALTTGYATIDKIRNTSYVSSIKPEESKGSKFANGGLLQGPSHGMGGIKTAMGELEGGEFVINKRSTANFLPLIQAINDQASANANPNSANAPAPIFKTYVVASEMTSTQEADKRVSDIARL